MKSSYSQGNSNCVDVTLIRDSPFYGPDTEYVMVQDTKDPGTFLFFTMKEWDELIRRFKGQL